MTNNTPQEKPTFAYWHIRGLAAPVRMLLAYTNTDCNLKNYQTGDAPDYDKSCWYDEKNSLGLDFPNLPYYIDGEVKITQSNAILRYIAQKHALIGKTPLEEAKCLELQDVAMDLRNGTTRIAYGGLVKGDWDEALEKYIEGLRSKVERFEAQLSKHKYFAGENLTFVDFMFFELLDQNNLMSEDKLLVDFPKIRAFMDDIRSMPELKVYFDTDYKLPVNNKMAKWGANPIPGKSNIWGIIT